MDHADQSALGGIASSNKRPKGSRATAAVGPIVLGLAAVCVASGAFLFKTYTLPSASMAPTLLKDDWVLSSRFAYAFGQQPQRGDLVVFRSPGGGRTSYVKRLIGLPGDRIQLKNGVVILNGKPLQREQLASTTEVGPLNAPHAVQLIRETLPSGKSYATYLYGSGGDAENTDVYVVPAGQYFVLADNRDDGMDSRYPQEIGGGYVPGENLTGRVDVAISPGLMNDNARNGQFLRLLK